MSALRALLEALSEALLGRPIGPSLGAYGLLLLRLLPLAFVAPFFGVRGAALGARLGAVLVLALVFGPLAATGPYGAPGGPQGTLPWLLAGGGEVALGALFALAASAPLYGLRWAGRLSDRLGGLRGGGLAAGASPLEEGGRSPLGLFYLLLGLALFAALGGHRLAARALAEGLLARPPGSPWPEGAALLELALAGAKAAGWALAFALSFAAPLMASLALLELSLGAAERVGPEGRATLLAAPLRPLLALSLVLLGLAVLVPHLPGLFRAALESAGRAMLAP